jgi:drug/metabolite transporter (DMT)-like permease
VVDRLIAVAGIAAISLAAILYHQSGASPATGAFFRAVYALPVLFWLARSHQVSGRMHALAFGGGMLFGIDIVLWHEAIGRIGTGLATVLANTQVVWVGLGAWVLLRERPPGRFFLALPVMLGGIALLAGLGDADAFGSDPIGGSLFGLTGALAYAGYLLIHRRVCRGERRPAAQLRDATLGMAFGALLCGLALPSGIDLMPSWPTHGWIVLLALTVQVGGWWALSTALPRLGSIEGSTMLLLQPIGTMVWGSLLLSEAPSSRQLAGAAAIVIGLAFMLVRLPKSQAGETSGTYQAGHRTEADRAQDSRAS